jgi:hypothetical protein
VQEDPGTAGHHGLEDATERAGIEISRGAILSEVREPDAVESRTNDKVQIVDDEPAVHRSGQRLIASIPAMDLVTAVAEIDAAVAAVDRAGRMFTPRFWARRTGRYPRLTSVMRHNRPIFRHSSIGWGRPVVAGRSHRQLPQRRLTTIADVPIDNLADII